MPTDCRVLEAFPPQMALPGPAGKAPASVGLGSHKVLASASGERWSSVIHARLCLTKFNAKARELNLSRFWPPLDLRPLDLRHLTSGPDTTLGLFPLRCTDLRTNISLASPQVTRAQGATEPQGPAELLPPRSPHSPGCLCVSYGTKPQLKGIVIKLSWVLPKAF